MRVGLGYDVHCLKTDEQLILGGVKLDYHLGLAGHSDADVLVHSIMDALLGAVGSRDIGKHFPDDDPKYEGISSLELLQEVIKLLEDKEFKLNNLDTIIIAQKPKLVTYINQMEKNIAKILKVNLNKINIKATTTEKLGFIGQEQGIAAKAIVSLKKVGEYKSC